MAEISIHLLLKVDFYTFQNSSRIRSLLPITSLMSQNFRLFHVSNLSVRNFLIFLLMYPESVATGDGTGRGRKWGEGKREGKGVIAD